MSESNATDDGPPRVDPEKCECYKCTEPEYAEGPSGTEYITNNMEHHTYGQECEECGAERTKYRDLGRKGRYVCPNCF